LGADTIVNLRGRALGKPADAEDARRTLRMLSGSVHQVHTGIVLIDSAHDLIYRDSAVTGVTFRPLPEEEIEAYIRTGEPFDKAGSYGIQGRGALFIRRVDGCFFNVMGLPLPRLWEVLQQWRRDLAAGGSGISRDEGPDES
jgi:septum formation protein